MERTTKIIPIKKTDEYQQLVFGEVYAPNIPDSDGDIMSSEEVTAMAHRFMKNQRLTNIDVQHDKNPINACVVESFIAQEGDQLFIPGAWVVGVHVEDSNAWDQIMKGELNGFSMQGLGLSRQVEVEVEIPELIKGETDTQEDHKHEFIVKYDEEATFLGGWTDEVNGHKHAILRGTATEVTNGHSHRFDHVEVFLNA
ncbi:MAG: hypothetical protein GWN00_01435 [Aliifodinibius sp.]|nr:hypothetical protein [Phycisphaerae bacterium]NIR62343.1 hypothetical protein [candidate division Zixibacteria bacterium]NIT54941.1 hypothetical protein [Fodinibius sp.]NIW43355.1 hypothetical protein [Gammaproteobacteria bacterium]NIU12576.1 hypothetical protein [candidate division Zixibacteria bacterium]